MLDYIGFWIAKTLAEAAVVILIMLAFFMLYALIMAPTWLRQRRCKHDGSKGFWNGRHWCHKCGKAL